MTKIKSIKSIGVHHVYDLNTPKHHNFILDNGILSHNSGKSWSSLSVGEQADPEFNIDRVVFSGGELMRLINSGKLKKEVLLFLKKQV